MFKYFTLATCLFLVAAAATVAQDKPAESTLPIGLINIEKIGQQHKPFVKQVAELQEQAKELQGSAALRQGELQTVVNDLQKTAQGTAEFQKLQNQAARLQRELQSFVAEGQQKIRDTDLKNSLALHREIDEVLKPYCKSKGLKLVIRMPGNSLDEKQSPQQILQALSRGVFYEDGLDITDDVLKLLAEKSEKGK
ncbi:MAG: OmpH family outer membrane protein [Planctomycetales bacterium]|nr:OmpH family outer membrane protein [Planctomycetales bacterium]